MIDSAAQQLMLEIIYQDDSLVAINKPSGLLVHRSDIDFHEQRNAQKILQQQLATRVFPVHRLDKPTSGVLLFAKDKDAAATMALQFQNHDIRKDYIAIVRGHTEDTGSIDNPVRDKDAPHKPRKPAFTTFKTLARITLPVAIDRYPEARYSLISLQPESGRRHQLRQHMKHISHPVIGDTSYGKSVHNQYFKQSFSCNRLLLHAARISFTHPVRKEIVNLTADYDELFKRMVDLEDWQWVSQNNLLVQ